MNEMELYSQGNELSISRDPNEVLEEARRAAVALRGVIDQTEAVVVIGTSRHLKSEAWQTLGHFYGLAARTPDDKTRFVTYGDVRGFEVTAELYHISSGKVVSEATAMCLNDEEKWGTRTKYEWRSEGGKRHRVAVGSENVPLFQLRSMAQTRAISRVHANALKWVVVLGGWSPTPAEEVENQNIPADNDAPMQMPQSKTGEGSGQKSQKKQSDSPLITEKQRKRMYAIGKGAGMNDEQMHDLIGEYGFEHSSQVTMDKYEEITGKMEKFSNDDQV